MLLKESTYKNQALLAQYCRTGKINEPMSVNLNRLAHYRRLIFNVVHDSLTAAYPLSHQLLGNRDWENLVHNFFSEHNCQSTQIWSMPKELIQYVKNSNHPIAYTYTILPELLNFEWLEVELYMQEDIPSTYKTNGNILTHKLIVNPEHQLHHFNFPVHLKIASEITSKDKGHFYLSLHRNPDSGKVIFTNLSPALVRVIEILEKNPANINELTEKLASEIRIGDKKTISEGLTGFITAAIKNKLILGYELD